LVAVAAPIPYQQRCAEPRKLRHLAWTFDHRAVLESVQGRVIVDGVFVLDELLRLAWEVVQGADGDAREYLDEVIISMDDVESQWERRFGHLMPDACVAESLFAIAMAPFLRPVPGLSPESVHALRYYSRVGGAGYDDVMLVGLPLALLVRSYSHCGYRMFRHRWDEGRYGGYHSAPVKHERAPVAKTWPDPPVSADERIRRQLGDGVADAVQKAKDEAHALRVISWESGLALRLCLVK
jgi:hypothetical protein